MAKLLTKEDLLNKLRGYVNTPDDENIRYKNIIKKELLNCPELLYSLNNKDLEKELFDEEGNLIVDENSNLIGEVDRFFGENALIRPLLYFPETQTNVKTYLCYQVMFDQVSHYIDNQKVTEIIFTIFVHGDDRIDIQTGIPRHDLIAAIIREHFNWSSIFGMQTKLTTSKEYIADNNYTVRTLIFTIKETNGMVYTPYQEESYIRNNEYWT